MPGKKKSKSLKRGRKNSDSQDLPSTKKLKVNCSSSRVSSVKSTLVEHQNLTKNNSCDSDNYKSGYDVDGEEFTYSPIPTPPLVYASDDDLLISQEISERASQIVDSIMQLANEESSDEETNETKSKATVSVSSDVCVSTPKSAIPFHVIQRHQENQCSTPHSECTKSPILKKATTDINLQGKVQDNANFIGNNCATKCSTKSSNHKLSSSKKRKHSKASSKSTNNSSSSRLTRQTHIAPDVRHFPLSVTVTTPLRVVYHTQKLLENRYDTENYLPFEDPNAFLLNSANKIPESIKLASKNNKRGNSPVSDSNKNHDVHPVEGISEAIHIEDSCKPQTDFKDERQRSTAKKQRNSTRKRSCNNDVLLSTNGCLNYNEEGEVRKPNGMTLELLSNSKSSNKRSSSRSNCAIAKKNGDGSMNNINLNKISHKSKLAKPGKSPSETDEYSTKSIFKTQSCNLAPSKNITSLNVAPPSSEIKAIPEKKSSDVAHGKKEKEDDNGPNKNIKRSMKKGQKRTSKQTLDKSEINDGNKKFNKSSGSSHKTALGFAPLTPPVTYPSLGPGPAPLPKTGRKYMGAHISAAGGIHNVFANARAIDAKSFAMFLRNQRQWAAKPFEEKHVLKYHEEAKGFPAHLILPHGSYLMNIGSCNPELLEKSRCLLEEELQRCLKLGIPHFNFHPGSCVGGKSREDCCLTIADSINIVHKKVPTVIVVLENMCRQGNTIGGDFHELRLIIEHVEDRTRVGVCLDTCHAHNAGYDLSTQEGFTSMIDDFDKIIGFQFLRGLHINDSKNEAGAHVDRHEHIGKGHIGLEGMKRIMNCPHFDDMPLILETPWVSDEGYAKEIKILEKMVQKDTSNTKKIK